MTVYVAGVPDINNAQAVTWSGTQTFNKVLFTGTSNDPAGSAAGMGLDSGANLVLNVPTGKVIYNKINAVVQEAITGTGLQSTTIDASSGAAANVVKFSSSRTTPSNLASYGGAADTLVMGGLGIAFTPTSTGSVMVICSCISFNSTVNDTTKSQISYGTGTAPVNAAALTGTQVGAVMNTGNNVNDNNDATCLAAVITGLTVGTAYWFDLAYCPSTGGASVIGLITYNIVEF